MSKDGLPQPLEPGANVEACHAVLPHGRMVKYSGRPQDRVSPSIRGSTRHWPNIDVSAIEDPATASPASSVREVFS